MALQQDLEPHMLYHCSSAGLRCGTFYVVPYVLLTEQEFTFPDY